MGREITADHHANRGTPHNRRHNGERPNCTALRRKRLIPVTVAKVGSNPDNHNDQRQDDRAWRCPKPVEENREASPPDTRKSRCRMRLRSLVSLGFGFGAHETPSGRQTSTLFFDLRSCCPQLNSKKAIIRVQSGTISGGSLTWKGPTPSIPRTLTAAEQGKDAHGIA